MAGTLWRRGNIPENRQTILLDRHEKSKQWIFIVEDCATKWVELFALSQASARQCATTLIEEVFMRHGIPRRIISDNGTQFLHFGKEANHEKLHPHQKINMFQARRLLQQQFPTEPSIPQQELLLQQLIMSSRRDVVGSIGEIVTPVV
ncbi:transposon Ty3-G Gag-Pol polyprotein [Trichonephila clavipes]|nr:transposon Ty3-G Gag-Pol polyprotein [Trichonephila clavipes]